MQDENMKISPYSYLENFNKMTIGQKIKYIRKQQNRSQKLLSEIAGVARTTITAYENEKYSDPYFVTINKIANALNVRVDELVYLYNPIK
ncbi:helix-turn-helix domain-containing protein, partial [uncultured Clostridium sp.]